MIGFIVDHGSKRSNILQMVMHSKAFPVILEVLGMKDEGRENCWEIGIATPACKIQLHQISQVFYGFWTSKIPGRTAYVVLAIAA